MGINCTNNRQELSGGEAFRTMEDDGVSRDVCQVCYTAYLILDALSETQWSSLDSREAVRLQLQDVLTDLRQQQAFIHSPLTVNHSGLQQMI